MKVILVNKFWYQHGGSERVVFATKKLLEKAGHEVQVFGMKNSRNEIENEYFSDYIDYKTMKGWDKFCAGLKAIYNCEAKKKFEKLVKDFKPDLIHFHNIYHQLSFSLLGVAKKYHVPTVMTLHDYKLICPNYNLFHHGRIDERCGFFSNYMESWPRTMIAQIERLVWRRSAFIKYINLFISPSRFLKDKFVSAGFPEEKITAIPNPVFDTLSASDVQSNGYVAYVGRLAPDKGIDVLLAVAGRLPSVKFKIIGTGPAEKHLKSLAKNLTNVEFTGYKKGSELQSLIASADILVVPSVWYENCPLSVLEAKLSGKIVVASKIGGLPELLSDDLLFRPGDVDSLAEKIKHWISAPEELKKAKGLSLRQEALAQNSPEKYYQDLISAYEKILADN